MFQALTSNRAVNVPDEIGLQSITLNKNCKRLPNAIPMTQGLVTIHVRGTTPIIENTDPKVSADQRGHGIGVALDVYTKASLINRAKAAEGLENSVFSA